MGACREADGSVRPVRNATQTVLHKRVAAHADTSPAGLPISDVTGPPHSAGLAGLRTRTSGYIMATRASAALAAFLRIVLGSAIG